MQIKRNWHSNIVSVKNLFPKQLYIFMHVIGYTYRPNYIKNVQQISAEEIT